MSNLAEMTEEELYNLRVAIMREMERRQILSSAPDQAAALAADFLRARDGEEDPDNPPPWQPVTGYHDAYPKGAIRTHEGKVWEATRDGASQEPGNSPDWREVAQGDEELDWVQPHAGSEYPVGAIVRHNGHRWRNDHTGPNGWEPGTNGSQWTDLGPIDE